MQPDWRGSLALGLKYKSVTLRSLFDIQSGGDIVSVSESNAALAGNAKITEDRAPFVYDGYNATSGNKNTVEITGEQFWNHIGGAYGTAEEFVYDASYVKMKELALLYTLPQAILNNTPFSRASISLVGRNLFYLLKHTPGIPDAGAYNRSVEAQAYDFGGLPATRTYGISLSVNF